EVGAAMSRAKCCANPAFLLFARQELDHAAGAPHVFAKVFAIVNACYAIEIDALAIEYRARFFEKSFKVLNCPGGVAMNIVPLAANQNLRAELAFTDGPGEQSFGPFIVRSHVYEINAQLKSLYEGVQRVLLGHNAQLSRSEANGRDHDAGL